jgi:hypothetical protein
VLYLYAIAEGPIDAGRIEDFAGDPFVFTADDITVIGATVDRAPAISAAALRAQDRVVRALHARAAALLPMRFGATAADYEALSASIGGKAVLLRQQLDLVRGREQMTIRVLGSAAAAAGSAGAGTGAGPDAGDVEHPGTRYLLERRAAAIPGALAPLTLALEPFARATRFEAGRHDGLIGTLYQLIDRGAALDYQRAAEEAGARLTELRLRISGPSPAYAFTS